MKVQEICSACWYHYSHYSSTIECFSPLITHFGTKKAAMKRRYDCLNLSMPYPREVDPALYECCVLIEQEDILEMEDWGSGSEWSLFAQLKRKFGSDNPEIAKINRDIDLRREEIQRKEGLDVNKAKKRAAKEKESRESIVDFLTEKGYKVICYSNCHEDSGKYSLAVIDPSIVTIREVTPLSLRAG